MPSWDISIPIRLPQHLVMIPDLMAHTFYLAHDLRTENIHPEIIRRPYPQLLLHPRSVQRAHGFAVDVVAHHGKARGQLPCLEIFRQRGLRHCGAEGAEFGEGKIEGHKVALVQISLLFLNIF